MVICFNPSDTNLFEKVTLYSGSLVLIAPKNKGPKNKVFKLSEIKDEPFIKIKNLKSNASQNNLDEVFKQKNINVNCISPGFIKTAMTDKIDDKFKEVIVSKIPSARLGEPDDIANAVLFLSSEQSNYINGETLHVNGGMYMA